jgi:hypothetical protein
MGEHACSVLVIVQIFVTVLDSRDHGSIQIWIYKEFAAEDYLIIVARLIIVNVSIESGIFWICTWGARTPCAFVAG